MRTSYAFLLSVSALGLTGCGRQISAPSLMPRPIEKQPVDMPVSAAAEAAMPADPALQAQLARQVAAAEAGDRDFVTQSAVAGKAVDGAAGAARGSEAWVQAQEAVTALEMSRVVVRDAAAAVDGLRNDPANASTGNRAAIDAAAARISEIEKSEAATVAALTAKLG